MRQLVAGRRPIHTPSPAATSAPAAVRGPGLSAGPPELGASRIRRTDRAFDLAAVVLLAPLLMPLALVLSLVVFLDSPGSIFYRARRIGLRGETFQMLKFRTMNSRADGPSLTRRNDERLTPVGRFLARTRMDELPQLWHVLTGEMRLVGPRPEDPEFVHMYQHEYEEILSVPPGITGSTQLVHFADGDELEGLDPLAYYAEQILPAKLELDAEYVRERSVWLDLRIIGATILLPVRLAASAVRSLASQHSGETAVLAAMVCVVLVMFAAVGGPAR
jgi:lipopolysaccharide/colanic/teichoic acid biosynthesis glycosyltransferase